MVIQIKTDGFNVGHLYPLIDSNKGGHSNIQLPSE